MSRILGIISFLAVLCALEPVQAQNLLVNGNLDLTPGQVYYDGSDPSVADDVPGWILSLGAVDGSYVLVSPEFSDPAAGINDADMAIGPARGGMLTVPLARPIVVGGLQYTATVTYDNYFAPSTTSYFIDWFGGLNNLISSNGGPLADLNGPLGYAPYTQLFSITAAAPLGAVSAGVRFETGDSGYAGLAADNFSLSQVPEPASAILIFLASLGSLSAWRRPRQRR